MFITVHFEPWIKMKHLDMVNTYIIIFMFHQMATIRELILIVLVLQCARAYYMGPGSTFRLGAFTCQSGNVSIHLEFESSSIGVNFITYAPDTNYGCVNIVNQYPTLSVINSEEFSGILTDNISLPLCYAFQNPSPTYSTNMNYYMNVMCNENQMSYETNTTIGTCSTTS